MAKPMPINEKNKAHRGVAEMARELIAEDPRFVNELRERLDQRQIVKSLVVLRLRAGLSQQELATKMGCSQSKISKIENDVDAEVLFGDFIGYLRAANHEAKIYIVPAGGGIVDEIKMHAVKLNQILNRMVELAETNGAMTKGVAAFVQEAASNLVKIAAKAVEAFPEISSKAPTPIRVEPLAAGDASERPANSAHGPSAARKPTRRPATKAEKPVNC